MRPIGRRETQITQEAVRLADSTTAALLAIVKRGSGATVIQRKAARRVLRIRAIPDRECENCGCHEHLPGPCDTCECSAVGASYEE